MFDSRQDLVAEVEEAAAPGSVTPRRRRRGFPLSSTLFLSSLVIFLAAWQIGSSSGWLEQDFFGSPWGVVHAGVDAVQTHMFWKDVWVSAKEFLGGYWLGVAVGVPFGIVLGWYRQAQFFFDPLLNAMNATPRIALTPLIILWLGFGLQSKVVVIFIGVFVTVVMNTFDGIRTVERNLLDVSQTFGASAVFRSRTVTLPGVLPFVITGMRLAVSHGISGVMVTEFFNSDAGLGFFIFKAGDNLQTNKLLFGALVMTSAAMVMFFLLARLERRVNRWRPARSG